MIRLKNTFNIAGINNFPNTLITRDNILFYASSCNIIADQIPFLRKGNEIKRLQIRENLILAENYKLEINNKYFIQTKDVITSINTIYNLFVFSTLKNIFIVVDEVIYELEIENVVSIEILTFENQLYIFCGTFDGVLYEISINEFRFGIKSSGAQENLNFENEYFINLDKNPSAIDVILKKNSILTELKNKKILKNFTTKKHKIHDDKITKIINFKNLIVTCSQDFTIKVFIFEKELTLIDTLIGHNDMVYDVFLNQENDHIEMMSVGADNLIIIWHINYSNQNILERSKVQSTKNYKSIKITKFIILHNLSKTPLFNILKIKDTIFVHGYKSALYKYKDYNLIESISGHSDKITTCDTKDNFILTGSADMTVKLFFVKNYQCREIARPVIHGHPISNVIFYNDKIAVGSEETIIRVYEPTEAVKKIEHECAENIETNSLKSITVNASIQSELSLTPEIKKIQLPSLNEHALQNFLLFKETKKIYGQFFSNSSICFKDNLLFFTNKSASLPFSGIFCSKNNSVVQYLQNHEFGVNKMMVYGNKLFAVSRDKFISIYMINDNKIDENQEILKNEKNAAVLTLENKSKIHSRSINTLSISQKNIATSSKDKSLKIFDHELNLQKEFYFDDEITSLLFFNEFLFCGQNDGTFLVINNFEIVLKEKICSKRINEIKKIENGIVVVSDDMMIRIFEIIKT